MEAMAPIVADFQVFQAVTVAATMEHSTALARTVTGGVLLRAIHLVPGTAGCFTTEAVQTGAPTIRRVGFLSVASGINSICSCSAGFANPAEQRSG